MFVNLLELLQFVCLIKYCFIKMHMGSWLGPLQATKLASLVAWRVGGVRCKQSYICPVCLSV